MRGTKKILLGFLAISIIVHSFFIPLALPGFVFCFGADGHLAIEIEKAVQHEHNDGNFDTLNQTLMANENCQNQPEDCFDISLDRYNDYQNKYLKISLKITWKSQNLFEINQEKNSDFFLLKHFFIDVNISSSETFRTIKTTHVLI